MSTVLPPPTSLPTQSTETLAGILDTLFERSTQLHTLCIDDVRKTPFSDYDSLITHVGLQLSQLHSSRLESDRIWLDAILSAHPRLGEKKPLSASSGREQAGLQDGGVEELTELNREYERCFPGLRYVPLSIIMEDMRERIKNPDGDRERRDAIQAMISIARDRVKKSQIG